MRKLLEYWLMKAQDISLAQAILVPFRGFGAAASPVDQDPLDERAKILENVPAQQQVVRGQIFAMIEQRAKAWTAKAEAETAALGSHGHEELNAGEVDRTKNDLAEMMRRIQTTMPPGSDGSSFTVKPGTKFLDVSGFSDSQRDADGDISMGDDSLFVPKPRTAKQIREKLNQDLQGLLEQGLRHLKAYDDHSGQVLRHYQKQVPGRKNSVAGLLVSAGIVPSPRDMNDSSPVTKFGPNNANQASPDSIRRLSTGMPGAAPPPKDKERLGRRFIGGDKSI